MTATTANETGSVEPAGGPFAPRHRLRTTLAMGIALAALYVGSLPNDTRSEWFRNLVRPDVLPRSLERLIPVIWLGLFLLGGVALPAVWAARRPVRWKWLVSGLLVLQLGLNYAYSYTFTMARDIPAAFGIAVALAVVTATIIAITAHARVWRAAACFVPYLAWVAFATYVTLLLARLNP
jgi:tryptophan-rich sensory protein